MALVYSLGFPRSTIRCSRPSALVRVAALVLTVASGRAVADATPFSKPAAGPSTDVQSVVLVPVADSVIRPSLARSNFGETRLLRTRPAPWVRNALVRFDQREINQQV